MCNRQVQGFVLILFSVMVASGCSGSQEASDSEPTETADVPGVFTDGSDPADSIDEQNVDATDATGSGDAPQTLDEYLGVGIFTLDPQERAANHARQEQKVQELIAQCMAREGFEYIPVSPPVDDFDFGTHGDVEQARELGFGVSTLFDRTEPPSSDDDDDWVDPNEEIVESLSESERDAYNETLHGTVFWSGGAGFDGDRPAEVDGSDGSEGCSGQALAEVFAVEEQLELLEQLDLESLAERIAADPRLAESYTDWSRCMAGRGYDYENPEALLDTVYGDLENRFAEIVGPAGGTVDPFQGMSREEIDEIFESLSPEELDDFFAQAEQAARAEIDREALAALQAEERALAVANAECSKGLYEQLDELYEEYEAALIDDNRALLEQFRDRREN